jgi:pimeloyl-ACP methyl ester carboxylesterase
MDRRAVEWVVELPGRGGTTVWEWPGRPGAPALLLVHGLTLTTELNWSAAVPALAGPFRVLAFDQRGHGRGLGWAGSYRLEDCADDAAAVAAALGVDRLIVAGYSMGGLIAQLVWRRHRELTTGLVLCATARDLAGNCLIHPAALPAPCFPPLAGLGADLLGRYLLDPATDRRRRDWALAQMRRTPLTTALAASSAVYRFSSQDWAGGIDVPTAVVVPSRDRVVPPGRQHRLAAAIPGAVAYELDGDHDVFLTAPGRFRTALLAAGALVSARACAANPAAS